MVHEWNRLIWWLGQNAGAIQALSSVATVFLTLTLVIVTVRYVRLTNHLAGTAFAQFRMSLQPDIMCHITFGMNTSEGSIAIHNNSSFPVKIRSVELQGRVLKEEWVELDAIDFGGMRGLIIPVSKELTQAFSMTKQVIKTIGWPGHADARCEFIVCILCRDQYGFFDHFYKYSQEQGLRYYSSKPHGFYKSKASPPRASQSQLNK